jgi:hypothetical protein
MIEGRTRCIPKDRCIDGVGSQIGLMLKTDALGGDNPVCGCSNASYNYDPVSGVC